MRKNKYELISEKELRKMNSVVVPLFGVQSRIVSGSFFLGEDDVLKCHITVGDTTLRKTTRTIVEIGKKVKKITKAKEVYCFGVKIAWAPKDTADIDFFDVCCVFLINMLEYIGKYRRK